MGRAIEDRILMAQNFDLSMALLDMLCGDYIGEGQTRIVFDCVLQPGWVVKIAKKPGCTDNIMEWEMWNSVCAQPEVSKWLAPCGYIADGGRVMLQKKVKPITDKNKKNIPAKIPAFLSDVKFANFGFIGKQLVSVDYAFSLSICGSAALNRKMKTFKSHLNEK